MANDVAAYLARVLVIPEGQQTANQADPVVEIQVAVIEVDVSVFPSDLPVTLILGQFFSYSLFWWHKVWR